MTTQELVALHERMCEQARNLMVRKNHDYAGSEKTFANFERVKAMDICEVNQGFFVRMCDKFSRLITLAKQEGVMVTDESVHDTLVDLINYPILYSGWLIEQQEKNDTTTNEKLSRSIKSHSQRRRRSRRSQRKDSGAFRVAVSSRPA